MIHLPCVQGSVEWINARIGIPTASCFDKLITPVKMKPSASAIPYLHEKLAEWLTGTTYDEAVAMFMDRGTALEDEAAAWYALETDTEPQEAGFFFRDDRMAGASPDRLVGEDGLVEIKCPNARTHVGYLLGSVAEAHKIQIQGQLYITGRSWCDAVSYCPGMPASRVRMERDELSITAISLAVDGFVETLNMAKKLLAERGYAQVAA